MADVHAIGVDETSSRRGHDYITLFVDLREKRLLFACVFHMKSATDSTANQPPVPPQTGHPFHGNSAT
ncbi:hypothetical protein [Acidithiobacillus thiooxidans]|uniref:hypothetical protein n=1 Tax=Acidithiobacillus thiooxidans TaxID=930 RepID=UPI00325B845A